MKPIDPNDPIYKGLTLPELRRLQCLSPEQKEEISRQIFGVPLSGTKDWKLQAEERWAALLGEVQQHGPTYRVSHADLMARLTSTAWARARAQTIPEHQSPHPATVSGFADWVLRLYAPPQNVYALLTGLRGERAVVDHRKLTRAAKKNIPRWEKSGWKLVHDGIRGAFDQAYSISSLTVNGIAVSGVPDLVFRERRTGRVLIVELKVSTADLPADGWPNLRAQLWAYARIDRWMDASEILLAGEVWTTDTGDPRRRGTYFWRNSDPTLQRECTELFHAYGGKVMLAA